MEAAVTALKMGRSTGVDYIPADLVKARGDTMIDVLTSVFNKLLKTGEIPTEQT